MKKYIYLVLALGLVLIAASCSSMAQGALSGALGAVVPGSGGVPSGGAATASAAAPVEFQSGEILASADSRSMFDSAFRLAKILTPASAATKNQAEALWVSDGKKQWVNYVIGSRKATKADFVVGAPVFYLRGWADHEKIPADDYRKAGWGLGNVTSVELLYKNQVEIDGDPYYIEYLRVPTDPVK